MFTKKSPLEIITKEIKDIKNSIREINAKVSSIQNGIRSSKKDAIETVAVFVDVQNMFYAARKQHAARLDYAKLLPYILKERKLFKAIAYVIENPDIDQSGFFSMLSHHDFRIKSKPLIQRANGSQKGDWDMGMALDILSIIDRVDVVALVSGDGDFSGLVNLIKQKGIKVEGYGFPMNTAIDLKEALDGFFPIGDELLLKDKE